MRPFPILSLVSFCVLFVYPAGAQTVKPAAPPTPKKLTLAEALSVLPPPQDGFWMTVGAEKVILPDSAPLPAAGADAGTAAAIFGDETISFGNVTAIAPQTMTLLNPKPDPPDSAANSNTYVASKMLFASLDDTQWQALISERGLGLADLTDDTQRGLFHAQFRRGQLWVCSNDPALQDSPEKQPADAQNLTDHIDATRLRLGQSALLYLHDTQGTTIAFSSPRPDAAAQLRLWEPKRPLSSTQVTDGVVLRAEVPNTLKPSDLDYDQQALQTSVSVSGLKTVGDLVTRIGQQTHLELYADPHYAAKLLTMTGTLATAPAADLLRAVCVCVTGTFRKVGPAYVLTDDLVGVGVRRKRLADWETQDEATVSKLENQAGAVMLHRRASDARKLSGFGDPLAVTPEEVAAVPDSPEMPGVPTLSGSSFPIAKLTAAQQAWLQQTAAKYDERLQANTLPEYLQDDNLAPADLTRTAQLSVKYKLQFLVPSLSKPVEAFTSPVGLLYFPGAEAEKAATEKEAKTPTLPPAPPLSVVLHSKRIRAVKGHPHSAAEVDALVAAMQKLGLNQLWLDVFSNGISHVKMPVGGGPDILTEAVSRTRGTGISVYADVSLLAWGAEPPDSLRDLTIDGLTSRQAAAQAVLGKEADPAKLPIAPPVKVSAAAPDVQTALTAVVQDLAARSGLAGFVWSDAETGDDLGYTSPIRLTFLRTAHADPVDITNEFSSNPSETLPLFDDKTVDADLSERWTKIRNDVDHALLRRLAELAVNNSGKPLPILVVQAEDNYLSWQGVLNDPKMEDKVKAMSPAQTAQFTQSLVTHWETITNDHDTQALARTLAEDMKSANSYVLDFSREEVTQGTAPLDALVEAVSAEQAKRGMAKGKN